MHLRRIATAALLLLSVSITTYARSNSLTVSLLDKDGAAVIGAIVSIHGPSLPAPEPMKVVLGQDELRFTPQILVVTEGTEVDFLNQDDITHHVYSFSRPWKQQFLLKQGEHQKYQLAKSGAVVLGCNIHDWMLAHLYILDTAIFGATDEHGKITLSGIPEGNFYLKIQHPRMRDGRGSIEKKVVITDDKNADIEVQLKKPLLPPHNQTPDLDSYQ